MSVKRVFEDRAKKLDSEWNVFLNKTTCVWSSSNKYRIDVPGWIVFDWSGPLDWPVNNWAWCAEDELWLMMGNLSLGGDILQLFVPVWPRQFYKTKAADLAVYCEDLSTGVLSRRFVLELQITGSGENSSGGGDTCTKVWIQHWFIVQINSTSVWQVYKLKTDTECWLLYG